VNRKMTKLILLMIFFLGISILLYPLVSQYFKSISQSRVITNYNKALSNISDSDYNTMFSHAEKYNRELTKLEIPLVMYREIKNYLELISFFDNGMLGYISIDKIKVELPIYHGTSSNVLNTSVGHLEGSSLPIGGINTHSVLSAHRGLPSAKLFTNLNKLEIGDTFVITILNRKLTYKVDNIVVVEPTDVLELEIIQDKDYVTLMTCTPYGINTHRLLVRGIRVQNEEEENILVVEDAYRIDKLIITLVITIPILIILIIYIMIKPKKKIL